MGGNTSTLENSRILICLTEVVNRCRGPEEIYGGPGFRRRKRRFSREEMLHFHGPNLILTC